MLDFDPGKVEEGIDMDMDEACREGGCIKRSHKGGHTGEITRRSFSSMTVIHIVVTRPGGGSIMVGWRGQGASGDGGVVSGGLHKVATGACQRGFYAAPPARAH